MQLLTFAKCLAIVGAISGVQSAPTSPNNSGLRVRDSINDCEDSSFVNQSSGGSPTVSDCQQIAINIAGGGTWSVGLGGEHRQLASYGTCVFEAGGDGSANIAYVGNQDIIDLINSSIGLFNWNGLVGAKGSMICQSAKGYVEEGRVNWEIYHS
jgi:hypothetical protein